MIADDHAIVRGGLKQLLALVDDVKVAGEAVNGEQVMEQLLSGSFDLVMLDMTMPGINGVDLITRMHDARLPILVFSMHNETQLVWCALKAGARGCLPPASAWNAMSSALTSPPCNRIVTIPPSRTCLLHHMCRHRKRSGMSPRCTGKAFRITRSCRRASATCC